MSDDGRSDPFDGPLFEALLSRPISVDRPRGSRHPRFPEVIYPIDYGYLDLRSVDGEGLDVFIGSLPGRSVTGVILCLDLPKQELEPKILISCTTQEIAMVRRFLEEQLHLLVWSSSDAS